MRAAPTAGGANSLRVSSLVIAFSAGAASGAVRNLDNRHVISVRPFLVIISVLFFWRTATPSVIGKFKSSRVSQVARVPVSKHVSAKMMPFSSSAFLTRGHHRDCPRRS